MANSATSIDNGGAVEAVLNDPLHSNNNNNRSSSNNNNLNIAGSRIYHSAPSVDAEENAVVVQPSFDDHGALDGAARSPRSPGDKSRERQSRSPREDKKEDEAEELRNPSSPDRAPAVKQERRGSHGHSRQLSALLDATSISDEIGGPEQLVGLEEDLAAGRKHRRMFSNGTSNPNMAHRRLNSKGNAAPVSRRHHRENSEGLEILSAAVDATKTEKTCSYETGNEPAAKKTPPSPWEQQTQPRVSSTGSAFSAGAARPSNPMAYGRPAQHQMQPPPPPRSQRVPYPTHLGYPHPYAAENAYLQYPTQPPHPYAVHHYGNNGAGPRPFSSSGQYSQQRLPEHYKRANEFDTSRPTRAQGLDRSASFEDSGSPPPPPPPPSEWDAQQPASRTSTGTAESGGASSTHQGVQTFVTAISMGGKGKTIVPTANKPRNAGTNTESTGPPVPAEVGHGHHRKLSSFSSLGTILGSSIFPGSEPAESSKNDKGHHRVTSSSVSFLNGLDVGLDDANFLRNLQASNASAGSTFRSSPHPMIPRASQPPAAEPMPRSPLPTSGGPYPMASVDSEETGGGILKLAAGGTSKRVRRKCTTPGCTNRVVQGGLCISHGAKRKTCKHPGCTKNVKKAGLCSTHGPARKRCEFPDCPKVAVQGGRCIAHGAKKKLCSVEACTKQAILSGMCKKHHDQAQLQKKSDEKQEFCRPVNTSGAQHKPTHTRGLSIFQDLSAEAVSSILNDPNATAKSSAAGTKPSESSGDQGLW